MKRELPNGIELDDDRERIDRGAVHRFLSEDSYWARERDRRISDELIDSAERVVGVYRGDELIGFSRTISDGYTTAYLADVFIDPELRGQGLGTELVRFSVDEGPFADVSKWLLHTADAHGLYRGVGFSEPDSRAMERWRAHR